MLLSDSPFVVGGDGVDGGGGGGAGLCLAGVLVVFVVV